jgi:hypothetical protein
METSSIKNRAGKVSTFLSLMFIIFSLGAFTLTGEKEQLLPQTPSDSVTAELSKINWDEVQKLSAKDGELLATFKSGESIMISRKAYLKYSQQNNKVDDGKYEKVFTIMEVSPEYPGGEKAWLKYIEDNLHISNIAREKNTGARVHVQFKVDVEGNISNVTDLSGHIEGITEEVIRVVKESGKWNPGIQNFRIVYALINKTIVIKPSNDVMI